MDRKRIIAWNKHWIGKILRSQWPKLVDWLPGFTTLWWLDAQYPDVAVRLTDALLERRVLHRQPYGRVPVRLDAVGCCAGDDKLFRWVQRQLGLAATHGPARMDMDNLLNELPFRPPEGLAFVAQRLELWKNAGARIDSDTLQAVRSYALDHGVQPATAAACIPQAGDWFVLKELSQVPAGLVACARSLGETVQQTAERLVKYAPFMGDALKIVAGATTFFPEPEDLIFLSLDGDGKAPWLRGTPSLVHVLAVARVLGRPVEGVLSLYPRYEFLDVHTPTFPHEELEAALPKDEADQLLLAGVHYSEGRPQISFTLLVQTAVKTRRPLGALLDRLGAFEKVGVTGEPLDFMPATDYQPEESDLRDLAQIDSMGLALGPLLATLVAGEDPHLFTTARRLGLVPAACSDEVIAGLAIDTVDVRILSQDGDGRFPWISRKLPRSHVGEIARTHDLDEQDLVRRVQRMAPLGVELLEEGKRQVL